MSKSQHFLGCKDKTSHQKTIMSESHSGLILHRVKFSRRDVEAFHNITGVSLYLRRKNCHFHFFFPKTSQFKRFSLGIPRLELFHVVALISSYCFFSSVYSSARSNNDVSDLHYILGAVDTCSYTVYNTSGNMTNVL